MDFEVWKKQKLKDRMDYLKGEVEGSNGDNGLKSRVSRNEDSIEKQEKDVKKIGDLYRTMNNKLNLILLAAILTGALEGIKTFFLK